MKKGNNVVKTIIWIFIAIVALKVIIPDDINVFNTKKEDTRKSNEIRILSSFENKPIESKIKEFAKDKKLDVEFTYMGDIDIVTELNENSKAYDAVWISNSMWLYMLDNSYLTSDSKSISISPVVMGVKNKKAESLGLKNREITNAEFVDLIKNKKIKYVMNSVTSTNTGATAYFGFLNSLAGNPEVLTKEMIDDQTLQNELINLFSGVERVSGDESYLEDMFLNNDSYEAVIADESSLININKQLKKAGKDELYLLYPTDGVAINDSTLAFIDNGFENEEAFLTLQSYLLSDEGQKLLESYGRRTWYGGTTTKADKKVFNPSWGINTNNYLNVTKYPSKEVMTYALNVYIELLRKPTHVVFVLDYSGSMYGEGIDELRNAMEYILTYEEAAKQNLQFSKKDKITIIPFSSYVLGTYYTPVGTDTSDLIYRVKSTSPNGSTALYDAIIEGLNILKNESSDYTTTIIAMTDGEVNIGTFRSLEHKYNSIGKEIPVYSITFGSADESQLLQIADLTNAKVFDGKTNLLGAFKEVRGYN